MKTKKKCPVNFACSDNVTQNDVFCDKLNNEALSVVDFKDIIPFLESEKKQIQIIIDFIKALPDDVCVPALRLMHQIWCLRRPAKDTLKIVLETEVEWLLDAHKKGWTILQVREKYPDLYDALEKMYDAKNNDDYLIQYLENKTQELINLNKRFKKI